MGVQLLRHKTCCFTGHRSLPEDEVPALRQRVCDRVAMMYRFGFDTYIAGGALGFDTLAAQEVLRMRDSPDFPKLKLVLALPFLGQEARWRPEEQAVYEQIKAMADEVIYTGDVYEKGLLLHRDRYMVDHSSHCIAYLKPGRTRGGTVYTVGYARKRGVMVTNLAN